MWAAHQLCELALTILNRPASQILTVQFDQVESNQYRIATVARAADQIEYGKDFCVRDDGFPVDQERVCGQSTHCCSRQWKPCCEIIAVAGDEAHSRSIPPRHDPEAVVLDFMNTVLSSGNPLPEG